MEGSEKNPDKKARVKSQAAGRHDLFGVAVLKARAGGSVNPGERGTPTTELFQIQMEFSFPLLHANDLRYSLMIIRAHSFLLSCT